MPNIGTPTKVARFSKGPVSVRTVTDPGLGCMDPSTSYRTGLVHESVPVYRSVFGSLYHSTELGMFEDISGTSAVNVRALTSRCPEVTVHIKHYNCLHTKFFDTKFATQLVFRLGSLPSSNGPQAAAQTATNSADIPSFMTHTD